MPSPTEILLEEIRGFREDLKTSTESATKQQALYEAQRDTLSDVTNDLWGNGQPGMKSDLQEAKHDVRDIKRDIATMKRVTFACALVIIGAVVRTGLAAWLR